MRLPHATRAAVRAVLLAELVSAEIRTRAAGCSPEALFDVLSVRLRTVAEDGEPAGDAGLLARPRSAAEDGQDRRHDAVDPGFVGEGRG
ncbi:hypothetical protein OG738_25370 [Amycolatopsis sp. NBC_01488]|uniref:hypothetical protein n=1 Tax=Amycolatopsis sp. NBC_01488 TaxID=2903563 RepID=UPI002E2B0BF0|nr:hypothetical protein [Amycolatopsis sp. NBC_01488]